MKGQSAPSSPPETPEPISGPVLLKRFRDEWFIPFGVAAINDNVFCVQERQQGIYNRISGSARLD